MENKISKFLNQNKSMSFNELLFSYIDERGFKDSEVYKKVSIDRKLFSKIRCNENYIPKKNNVIKLSLALSLDKQELQKLLFSAGYTLCTNNDFDLVILFCVENKVYDLNVVNDYLYTFTNTILNW